MGSPTNIDKRISDATREVNIAFWKENKNEISIWISKPNKKAIIRYDIDLKKRTTETHEWWNNLDENEL